MQEEIRRPGRRDDRSGDGQSCGQNPEEKTNLQLLDELDAYISSAGENGLDGEVVRAYLDKLQERAPVELGDEEAIRRTLPLQGLGNGAEPASRRSRRRKVGRALVILAAALILALVAGAALGHRPLQTAVQWLQEVTYARMNPSGSLSLPEGVEAEYTSLQDALDQNGVDVAIPTWIPSEYAFEYATVREYNEQTRIVGFYTSSKHITLRIQITSSNASYGTYMEEKLQDTDELYEYNGRQYSIVENSLNSRISWEIGEYICEISGELARTELIQMVKSIEQ